MTSGWFSALILASAINNAAAMFEDQAFKFDWRQQYIGVAQKVEFYEPPRSTRNKDLVVVQTESNVLAALDGDNGRIVWRQIFAESLRDFALVEKTVRTLSIDDARNVFTRTWNVLNGALLTEKRSQLEPEDDNDPLLAAFLHDSKPYLVRRTGQNGLRVLAEKTGDVFDVIRTYSTGSTASDISCTNLKDTLVCLSAQMSAVYSTPVPFTSTSLSVAQLSTLGISSPPVAAAKADPVDGEKIQVGLQDGSLALLAFKAGKFASVNTIRSKATIRAAGCANGDIFTVEQTGDKLAISRGASRFTYEPSGERGSPEKVWPLCDREDPEVFQLVLRSRDGSLVSVTPLGNIMWEREDGLADIAEVELVSRASNAYDVEEERQPTHDVVKMLVRRLKHHLAQLYTVATRLRSMKDVAMMLIGNSDDSYDDFGIRKVIVAVTRHAKVYGIDSKSGKILWHLVFDGDEKFPARVFVQRASSAAFDAQCALVYRGETSGKVEIAKFDPVSGRRVDAVHVSSKLSKINKAILMHQSDPNDHIRPILLLDDGPVYELEPANAAENLRSVSGKVFIAIVSSDRQEIQGFRLSVRENNRLRLTPVWSFSSGGASILSVVPKSADEVVHSHGRVMADRSVLFKYLNPNLAFVLSEGADSGAKAFVNIYLIDLVTGKVVFSASHKKVAGPYRIVHSENWAIYSYYNDKARRAELASLELFEGKAQNNATVFSSLHNNVSPLVERQAFILGPSYATALSDTRTEKGITTKNLLMATSSGSVFNVPRPFVDPRRPNMNTPPEAREPGLPGYTPELAFPAEFVLNYNQTLALTRGIATAPTGLESTSVVFVYGLDLFCTRVTPSKGFDLLKDDFDHYVIASVLAALTAAAYVTRKLAQRKNLMQAWR